MQPVTATQSINRLSRRLFVALLALAFVGVAAPGIDGAAAAPSCLGKKATIVSNAAKIVGTKAPDVIVAGGGDNTIYGEGGNDTICGGPGDDTIYGGRGVDTIDGQGGDDTIYAERGSDHLSGGDGDDTLHGERGSDHIFGDAGNDLVLGESGNDHLDGGGGSDRVSGGPGDDHLDGGPGDYDVLSGGPGNDDIDGGPGEHDIADYAGTGGGLNINLQTQRVDGAEGENLHGIEDAIGGSGPDTIIGSSAPNRLDGGPGSDNLVASGPGDEAFGGPGGDQCGGGFAMETSCGPADGVNAMTVELYESIDGTTSLILTGSPGNDVGTVSYSGGVYTVQGGPGGSPVELGDPTSTACSLGADSVSCQGEVDSILAALDGGNDELTIAQSVPADVSANLEGGKGSDTLRGGRGNDVLYAGEDHEPDTLEGGGGDDVLYGVNIFHPRKDSGAATMNGGPGSDLLIGGQPCDGDTFDGGPGPNDSASFARVRNSGIFVEATIGGAVLDPDVGNCNAGHIDNSVEKIEGSPGRDILNGDNGPNVILGRGGNDRINGKGGHDGCVGGTGHDQAKNCEVTASVP